MRQNVSTWPFSNKTHWWQASIHFKLPPHLTTCSFRKAQVAKYPKEPFGMTFIKLVLREYFVSTLSTCEEWAFFFFIENWEVAVVIIPQGKGRWKYVSCIGIAAGHIVTVHFTFSHPCPLARHNYTPIQASLKVFAPITSFGTGREDVYPLCRCPAGNMLLCVCERDCRIRVVRWGELKGEWWWDHASLLKEVKSGASHGWQDSLQMPPSHHSVSWHLVLVC